jgi:hypothetical protein
MLPGDGGAFRVQWRSDDLASPLVDGEVQITTQPLPGLSCMECVDLRYADARPKPSAGSCRHERAKFLGQNNAIRGMCCPSSLLTPVSSMTCPAPEG